MAAEGTPLIITTDSEAATQTAGRALAPLLTAGDVLVLSGDLGAGKTQLTKGIAGGLGVSEPVTSPTFNLLLVHEGRLPLYHFDLYRLDSAAQLEDLDYWGTLESGGVSVVEWGDRFADAIPADCVIARIRITGDDSRALELEARGARGAALASAWIAAAGQGGAGASS
ncbi:MAG: tRNA (adenosine(37)-N6)-threonylcarbamoyltransferase complex ATPase subunit type 1 TsaE [Coriobacteriia bacterium]|nr:tRNA (adenosine(37)-N6)-threonylcarbamoyltransferase complex ATPase subunit type 1 TsaE [Coriobacteriia bacterium]